MKKFYFLFSLVVVSISCTPDSSEATLDPNLLQRIDFYPGTLYERRWLFNPDGLLNEITKTDGTVVQTFTYDSHNRLISSTKFEDSGISETHTFTYDSSDFVTSVDGVTVNYDSSLGAYYTGVLTDYYRLTKLNSEKLLVDGKSVYVEIDGGIPYETEWYQMSVSYANYNVVSYSPGDSCNYLTYDDKINPLRNATLAISRAFSFIENSRWVDGQYISANNVLSHDYCSEDPESELFHYTYNANNLPLSQTRDNYYLGTYENTTTSANYYYQGDVLP